MFCNAIDDALMGVTHVLRGEDHLTNTPRQIMILESLGLPVPQYGHISLITGLAGDKLSKRRGSFSLDDVRQDGILPLALINYLARLGHYYAENNFMSLSELATHFKTESLNTSSAKFDKPQLMHWQKKAIVALDTETFWQWMGEAVHTLVPTDSKDSFIEAIKTIVIVPDDAFYWAQIFFGDSLTFDDDKIAILQNVGAAFYEHALRSVAQHGTDSGKTIAVLKEKTGLTGKPLFLPLRLALTGEAHGPDLQTVFTLLGTDLLEQRLNYVQSLL
jgi:glutamyl/glutaminyl-tRNA synthetase